jgi:pimeloyl-ACP methyl ester carboxylesterase
MRRDEFCELDVVEIHYSEWGAADAPPVVCVHGLSRVGRDFDPLARELADDYRVLCPDMPGRGLSEWSPAHYEPAAMVDLLVEFYDELGLESTRYVGTSMGGTLGIRLAADELADRIDALVLNDVGPEPAEDEGAEEGIQRIIDYLTNPPTYDRFTEMEAYFREAYATFNEQSDAEWRRLTRTSSRRTDDGQFTPNYDTRIVEPVVTAESERDPWDLWEAVDVPTLVLRGADSDILGEGTFEEMLRRGPETESLVVDCGHAPALNTDEQHSAVRSSFPD